MPQIILDRSRLTEYGNVLVHESKGGSYAVKIRRDGRNVACAYLTPQKKFHKLYKVFVDEKYRGNGYGDEVMQAVIDNFGDLDIYLGAHPNRISDMNEDNKDYYREKLFSFYEKFGFVRKPTTSNMYRINYPEETIEDMFE